MMLSFPNGSVKEIEIEAVVVRANGSVEKLGSIGYWHSNPLMRLWHKIKGVF